MRAVDQPFALQLEVLLAGQSTNLVGGFTQLPDGSFAATRAELKELGIVPPGEGAPDDLVRLEDIPGTTYSYSPETQSIDISLPDKQRIASQFDATGEGTVPDVAVPGIGTVFNYSLFAAGGSSGNDEIVTLDVASALVDARLYGPLGVLTSAQIAQIDLEETGELIRLDTAWTASDPERMLTYRVGDLITGGLNWTRSVRLGGVQISRNFALRPDLVTMPLPTMSGSAAVPSTVEVYVNNIRTHTQNVPAGPFEISNIPTISGSGTARLVVRDAQGRETETTAPFFASSDLLRKGLYDFSGEIGVARTESTESLGEYSDAPVASFSGRYGWTDEITLEGHAEGGAGLINAGAGLTADIGDWAIASFAASASSADGDTGGQLFASIETSLFGATIYASTLRTFGDYNDLGSVTGEEVASDIDATGVIGHRLSKGPPKAIDQISLGLPLGEGESPISLNFANLEYVDEEPTQILSATYSRQITQDISSFVSGFSRFGEDDGYGVYAGVSWSIGDYGTLSSGISHQRDGTGYTAQYSKPTGSEPGSYGWQARVTEGETSSQHAQLNFRGSIVDAHAGAIHVDNAVVAYGGMDGAVVVADGGLFLSRRIADAFAIVDAGVPDVEVTFQNRPVATTNASGKALVPGLFSYQENNISVNALDLPLNTAIPEESVVTVPPALSGVNVKFDKVEHVDAALLVLRDAAGDYLPVGRRGKVVETGEEFFIGYDGQAYVTGLGASNSLTVTLAEGECHATFAYAAEENAQVKIDPVTCQ